MLFQHRLSIWGVLLLVSIGFVTLFSCNLSDGFRIRWIADPVLAPDGKSILFSAPINGKGSDLFFVRLDGKGVTPLITGPGFQGQPCVSLDGKMILYVDERDGLPAIWIADISGQNRRRLTKSIYAEDSPKISSDGKQVAFVRRLTTNPDDSLHNEVFVIDIDGNNERQLTKDLHPAVSVRFSSDSASLYVASEGGCNEVTVGNGTYLFKVSLANLKTSLICSAGETIGGVDVSQDEQVVTYIDSPQRDFNSEVFSCSIDGTNNQQLTRLGGYITVAQFGFHSDQITFLFEPKRDGTGDIYLYDIRRHVQHKVFSTANMK